MGWSDAVGLSGYAAAFADAMAHGASYDQAYNAASAATGQSGYSSFNDSGGASYHSVNYNDPYVSAAQSLLSSTVPTTANYNTNTTQQAAKSTSDKVYSSLLPDTKTTAKDLLGQYGNAIVRDYNGNPVAIDFSQPNWQLAWTALWGAGNQIVTDSTNPNNIGLKIENVAGNSNPVVWTQQASKGALFNNQGGVIGVNPTVQQLAQAVLDKVNADKGATQQQVINSFKDANNAYWKERGLPVPDYYSKLDNYQWTPLQGISYQDYLINSIPTIDTSMLTPAEQAIVANMTPAEQAQLADMVNSYRGGVW